MISNVVRCLYLAMWCDFSISPDKFSTRNSLALIVRYNGRECGRDFPLDFLPSNQYTIIKKRHRHNTKGISDANQRIP